MNKGYILGKIQPYLSIDKKLAENDFNSIFSVLTKLQQYEVIRLLIQEGIEIDYENESSDKPAQLQQKEPKIRYPEINRFKKLSNEQLCIIYQQGNKYALDALISNNSKLVWSRVRKYSRRYNHKLDEDDLYQYGILGLMSAADKYEVKKEAKFTTYSIWWIDQKIIRGIVDCGFTVRLPVHYFEQVSKLIGIFAHNPGFTKVEMKELAKQKGISGEKFEELLMVSNNIMSPSSLNSIVGEDEECELGDLILEDTCPSVEEQVEENILKEILADILNTLKPREKEIIEQRFGFNDEIPMTLEQVGAKYNLTRERIRQIEKKAIRRMRHPSRSKQIKNFY